jgi:aspartate/methionine/tyrosine aminotransferase
MRELLDSIELSLVRKLSEQCNGATLRLGLGEPSLPLSTELEALFIEQMRRPITTYSPTDGLPELKSFLGESYAREFSKDNLQICVTTGSMQALYMTLGGLTVPGDECLAVSPRYPGYASLFHLFGLSSKYADRSKEGRLPVSQLLDAISNKTKFILLNSPNNPTGAVDSKQDLQALFKGLEGSGIRVILDEVYFGFSREPMFSAFGFQNTILIRGISKTFGLTGFRLGWLASDDAKLMSRVKKFQQNINTCPNTLVQYFALELLKDDRGRCNTLLASFERGRRLVMDFCKEAGLSHYPVDGAFYGYICLQGTKYENKSLDFGMDLLKQKNVLVVPGCSFSPKVDNYFRINILLEPEVLQDAFTRIKVQLFE